MYCTPVHLEVDSQTCLSKNIEPHKHDKYVQCKLIYMLAIMFKHFFIFLMEIEDASDLSLHIKEILNCDYTGPINAGHKDSIIRFNLLIFFLFIQIKASCMVKCTPPLRWPRKIGYLNFSWMLCQLMVFPTSPPLPHRHLWTMHPRSNNISSEELCELWLRLTGARFLSHNQKKTRKQSNIDLVLHW